MPRPFLYACLIILAAVAAYFAYDAYERDRNTMQIEIGPGGIKVDPPSR